MRPNRDDDNDSGAPKTLEEIREFFDTHTHLKPELARAIDVALDEMLRTKCGAVLPFIEATFDASAQNALRAGVPVGDLDRAAIVERTLLTVVSQRLFERAMLRTLSEDQQVFEAFTAELSKFMECLFAGHLLLESFGKAADRAGK